MKVYITGIAGFLGSHLADYFIANGDQVRGCDDLSSGLASNISPEVEWSVVDITRSYNWLWNDMKGCDIVFHTAAAAYEGVSVFLPAFISENIYTGSANVFSAAIKAGVKRVVNCSSMARYGYGTAPFEEYSLCRPVDPYGLAKYSAEVLGEMLSQVHKIEFCTAVPHNIYGPRQNYWTPYRNVTAIMINRMLKGLQPVIYGDGAQKRCFSYIDDMIPAMVKMATHDHVVYPIINIGPGDNEKVTILELAELLADIIGFKLDPIFMPPRPREVLYATCADRLARTVLAFKATVSLREGLERQVKSINAPKDFAYNLIIELPGAPKTWTEKLI